MKPGDTFGRWQIIAPAQPHYFPSNPERGVSVWLCRCICGTEREVLELTLKAKTSTSCGCWTIERSIEANKTHGETLGGKSSPEYNVWGAMRERCNNPNNSRYSSYGGRGITVCEKWNNSFSNFLNDMGRRPSPKHSIDRIDNNLGYTPDNCRWAIPHKQMTNRRNSFHVNVDGKQIPLSDLAIQYNIPANTLRFRILKGWSLTEALTAPVRPKRRSE